MNQLSGIFLHMNFMNTNFLFTGRRVDRDIAVVADREIQLGNLVVLRVIRVKIVFPVKFTELVDTAVCRQTDRHRVFNNLLI